MRKKFAQSLCRFSNTICISMYLTMNNLKLKSCTDEYFESVDNMRILPDNYVTQLIYWISAEMYDTCISNMLCIKSKQHSSCVSASSWFGSRKGNKMRLECNMDMMICAFMWVEQSFISLHKRMKGLIDKGIFFFKKNLK